MTKEESKQVKGLLKKVRILKSEYEEASKKVTELMQAEEGFTDLQDHYEIACEIYSFMDIETRKFDEYIEAKWVFKKFIAKLKILESQRSMQLP